AFIIWSKWAKEPRGGLLALWVLVMTLEIYAHYFGLLLLAGFVVVNWIYGKRRILFTAAAALPGLAFIPWVLYLAPTYRTHRLQQNLGWVNRNPINSVLEAPFQFL